MASSPTHRITRQRRVVLLALRKRFDHPSADMIYEDVRQQMPRISLGTVYRNLDVLTSLGLIVKIDGGGGQARYDGNPRSHCHAVCTECGRIEDVPDHAVHAFEYDSEAIEQFEVRGHEIRFTGTCAACSASAARGSA